MHFEYYGHKLRAILSGEDLREFHLTYDDIDYDSPATRFALLRILEEAHTVIDYDPPSGKLFVEVYPYQDGCVVYFSASGHRSPYGGRSEACASVVQPVIFTFPDCEEMISACARVFRLCCHRIYKSALYYLDGQYRLILYPLDGNDARHADREGLSVACLCEFAEPTGEGDLLAAFVAEHGMPIAEENAIDKISYYLS